MRQAADEFHFSPRPNRAAEINWRHWSAEPFEQARQSGRPILLAISAVWCHWCHVMDETTYSNPGVIELINREYVPIRVDNDLRPDINQRYNMGGWPTTAFLTPSGDILTGATYLTPEQMADALAKVASYHRTHQAEIATAALESRKRAGASAGLGAGDLSPTLVDSILEMGAAAYDPHHGGFGDEPKFPQTDALLLLLEQGALRADARLSRMAVHSLEQMAGGGMYDHVEGGFFRYSTTRDWSVPHFEKMLEDHAGLVSCLALAGMRDVMDTTTGYLDNVLRDPATGLYAGSQDADEEYYALDAAGRALREAPFVDTRQYTAWNAALAVAYLEAAARLGLPRLRDEAGLLLTRLFRDAYDPETGMAHASGAGGLLADQVWALLAAVRAFQSGLGPEWLVRAQELAQLLEKLFGDPGRGGYLDRTHDAQLGRLADPIKPLVENSVGAIALTELDALLGDPAAAHGDRARLALGAVAGTALRNGLMASVFARALDRLDKTVKVTTANPELQSTARQAHPYAVIDPRGDERAVVCVGTICLAPVSDSPALVQAIHDAAHTRA